MDGINLVVMGGNLGRDPEYYEGAEGKDTIGRCTFPLIVDYPLPEGKKGSDRFNIIAWGKTCEYLMGKVKKGTFLVFQGSQHTRSYVDKDMRTVYITENRVEKVIATRDPRGVDSKVEKEW